VVPVSDTLKASAVPSAKMHSAEVSVAPKSKRYSASFKLRILEEAEGCQVPGELAALLRREGIYFSTLSDFRKQKARGDLDGKRPSSTPKEVASPQIVAELAASEREVRRLRRELYCATALLELQKKVSDLLGVALTPLE
jgi:transposase